MITEDELVDLRTATSMAFIWFKRELVSIDTKRLWICLKNQDETQRITLEVLSSVREALLDNEVFDNTSSRLTDNLMGKTKIEPQGIEEIIGSHINSFITKCALDPGPQEYLDELMVPHVRWVIEFKEDVFQEEVLMIAEKLRMGFLDSSTYVRVKCEGFRFTEDFSLDENISYEMNSNKWVIKVLDDQRLEQISSQSSVVLGRLSVLLKLLYGFNTGLGVPYVMYPLSKGGTVHKLGKVSNARPAMEMVLNEQSTIQSQWASFNLGASKADPTSTLIAKIEVLANAQSSEELLLDLMTCYEMVLSEGAEIAFRLTVRSTVLLTQLGEQAVFDTIDQAYKDRSKIIHGGLSSIQLGESHVITNNAKLLEWLRALALLRLLDGVQKDKFLAKVDNLVRYKLDPDTVSETEKVELQGNIKQIEVVSKILAANSGVRT